MARNSVVKSKIRSAIFLTIAYTDQFDFPLSESEIYLRLIWHHKFDKPEIKDITYELKLLRKEGFVQFSDGFYFLKNRGRLPKIRILRQNYASLQRKEIKPLLDFLQKIPWIQGVVVTGSLALNAISATDDSDFLLVVQPKRLWLTRVLVIYYAWLKGKRRSWRYEEENSWCFNLWLDRDHLVLPREQRSVYTAHEVCQSDWIWWRGEVAKEFYLQNQWVREILPNYWQNKLQKYSQISFSLDNLSNPLSIIVDGLDYLAFLTQLLYMKPHRTREKVSRGLAFFHPRDTKLLISTGWRKSIKKAVREDES